MTAAPIDVAALTGTLEEIETQVAAAAADGDTARKAAEEAAEAARQLEDAVWAAQQRARTAKSGAFLARMRELTGEVRDARARALDAVRTGGDVDGSWLAYHETRARNKAAWDALGGAYASAMGDRAPGGDWGPPLVASPEDPGFAESFDTFITRAAIDHAREVATETRAAMNSAIEARREAQRAG